MVKWGIIGCGNVTEVKSGPAFNKVSNSKLVAVMRRNKELAEDYARRHGVPKYYSDASQLINDPEVNAIYVATPPSSHMEYALAAIRAGKPVYIEKPMALNHAECEIINNEGALHGVPVYVAYYRRALPGFVKVKELISSGTIGNILSVKIELFKSPSAEEKEKKISWRVQPEISGGGHFFDLASHQLDYIDYLFGPLQVKGSLALNQSGLYDAEDYVSAGFLCDNNVAVTGLWCFSAHPSSDRDIIEITGTKGSIVFSSFTFDPIKVTNENKYTEYINERPEHVQYYLIEQVVNDINSRSGVVSTGISGARTSRVMDEIVREYYGR